MTVPTATSILLLGKFNNKPIHVDKNGLMNMTEMCLANGVSLTRFLENEGTKAFMAELSDLMRIPASNLIVEISNGRRGRKHRWGPKPLGFKLAAWIAARFELWVYTRIEDLFTHGFTTIDSLPTDKTVPDLTGSLAERLIGELASCRNALSTATEQVIQMAKLQADMTQKAMTILADMQRQPAQVVNTTVHTTAVPQVAPPAATTQPAVTQETDDRVPVEIAALEISPWLRERLRQPLLIPGLPDFSSLRGWRDANTYRQHLMQEGRYYPTYEYAYLNGIRLNRQDSAAIGLYLTAYCRQHSIPMAETSTQNYKKLTMYPDFVLAALFDLDIPDVPPLPPTALAPSHN